MERVALLESEQAELEDRAVFARTGIADLDRELRKAEADVEAVRSRRVRDEERLSSGQVGSPRELEQLQHEVASLERRIADLEDAQLEVMERADDAQQELDRIDERLTELGGELAEQRRLRDTALAEIDEESSETTIARDKTAGGLPADLLTLYERLRANNAGVGAAQLVQRRCTGCRLELTAADLRAIKAADEDEVSRCEQCGRILVITSESGL